MAPSLCYTFLGEATPASRNTQESHVNKPYDTFELLTVQDYGPWLDRLSLHRVDGNVYLKEEFGYAKPLGQFWHSLSREPTVTLSAAFGSHRGLLCGNGDPRDFQELGVEVTRCEDPTRLASTVGGTNPQ